MALGDFKLFKENAGGSFDERTVAAAPGKVFSWDEEYDPVTIDVVPYRMAKDDVDLNGKALVNVANLGVGIAAPDATLHVVREEAGSIVSQNMYVDTAAGAAIQFRKARGSFLSPAAAQNNDGAGGFVAQFYDGSGFGNTAAIRIYATQNQTSGKHGGKIVFQTVANDTTALTERMVIQHDGKIGIGTSNPQKTLHVNGDIEASNYYHDNFQGISERIDIVDSAGTHTLTFSGGLLIDYELI